MLVYSKLKERQGEVVDGNVYVWPAGSEHGAGVIEVPDAAARELVRLYPERFTVEKHVAAGTVGEYCPGFTPAHRTLVEGMTEAELCVVLRFLSAGKEVRRMGYWGPDLLLDRVLRWLSGAAAVPDGIKAAEDEHDRTAGAADQARAERNEAVLKAAEEQAERERRGAGKGRAARQ